MAKDDIRQYTPDELRQLNRQGKYTKTRPDAPEHELDESFWDNARILFPAIEGKDAVKLRIDREILAFFRAGGRSYQTRMNAVLRAYVEVQKKKLEGKQKIRSPHRCRGLST